MLTFFNQNLGTIIVGALLLVVVTLIIRSMIKDKKAGKSSCGGNCAGCGMNCSCHNTVNQH